MSKSGKNILQGIKNDNERLDNAYAALEDTIRKGRKKTFLKSEDASLDRPVALKYICDYMGIEAPSFDPYSLNSEAYITEVLRKNGVLSRPCVLTEGWYRNAVCVYLIELDGGRLAALMPDSFGRYYYHDLVTGHRVFINKFNAGRIQKNAFMYYIPLPQNAISERGLFRFMMKTVKKGDCILAAVSALLIVLIGMFLPIANSLMLGFVIPERNAEMIASLAAFLISSILARYFISVSQNLTVSRITQRMTIYLQSALFARTLDLPVDFFRKHSTGDIYGALTYVEPLCTTWCNIWFSSGVTLLFSALYLFQLRGTVPTMLIPAACVLGIELLLQIIGIIGQRKNVNDKLNRQVATNTLALDLLTGIEQIKVNGAQKRTLARYAEVYKLQSDAEYNPPFFVKLQKALLPAVNIFGMGILFYFADKSNISSTQFIFFYTAYGLTSAAVFALSGLGSQIASIGPIVHLLKPMLEEKPEITNVGRDPGRLLGKISAEHLEFRYANDAPPVLKDFTLSIEKGEYIAIVGGSGSGKTTFTRLLLGFDTPQSGAIYYDGNNLRQLDLALLRQQIGVVMQDGRLFTGNIFTNIALSSPGLTEEEAWKAAEMAGIADDIRAMPLGMYTIVSDGAGTLSGGQKQRLLIARVIAQKPSLLILDEATSALDNVTQKTVTEALASLKCTRIVIAHRLSTVKDCDRIVLLEHGQIIEEGSYEELMKKNGKFAELVRYQLLEDAVPGEKFNDM